MSISPSLCMCTVFCLHSNTFKLITYVDANASGVYHSIFSLNEHTHTYVFILIHMCQPLAHKSSYHRLHFDTPLHVHVNLQGETEIEEFGCITVTTCCRCLRFHKTSRTCSRLLHVRLLPFSGCGVT